ncbi:MAG TPA: hypothetical protein EYG03_07725 [Planctomycetes bacterium]|nr:hypothetical protein [Fuerstiella sp.]HIK91857.1 hypothetical protein [Planctomycetota bacterium]
MSFRWHVIVTLLLITGATGCSRFREMTRRDYALLRDPFINRFGAGDEIADAATPFSDAAGRVSIDDTSTAAANYGVLAEFDTAEVPFGPSAGDRRLDEIRVGGDIAGTSGPSLSDFIGKRPESSQTAMLPELKYPEARGNAEGFGAFAEQGTAATARNIAAGAINDNFTVWASSQNEEWSNRAGQSVSTHIQQVSQVLNTTTTADDDDLPSLPSLDSGTIQSRADDTATPLIRPAAQNFVSGAQETSMHPPVGRGNPFANTASRINARTLPQPQVPVFDVPAATANTAANFDMKQPPQPPVINAAAPKSADAINPFAEFDQAKSLGMDPFAAAADKTNPASRAPVDSTFRFDTGWKPSNLERP